MVVSLERLGTSNFTGLLEESQLLAFLHGYLTCQKNYNSQTIYFNFTHLLSESPGFFHGAFSVAVVLSYRGGLSYEHQKQLTPSFYIYRGEKI